MYQSGQVGSRTRNGVRDCERLVSTAGRWGYLATNRQTGVSGKFFTRVDVTEEFCS